MAVGRLTQLVFECDDAVALARFWQQVLDLPEPTEEPWRAKGAGDESRACAGGKGGERDGGGWEAGGWDGGGWDGGDRASVVGDARDLAGDARDLAGDMRDRALAGEERPEWVTLEWGPVGRFSFHRCEGYVPPRWPRGCGEHQVHFDLLVEDLAEACGVVEEAGGRPLTPILDPGPKEWRIYADPAGHPFCLVTVPE